MAKDLKKFNSKLDKLIGGAAESGLDENQVVMALRAAADRIDPPVAALEVTSAPSHGDVDVIEFIRSKAAAAAKHNMPDTVRVLEMLAGDLEQSLHTAMEDPAKALREITDMIGKANVSAGWWTDGSTDLRDCLHTVHVVGGKLMLVVTEISEGMEGWRKSQKGTILMDDHLPHRPMLEVELADAHIRLFDIGSNVRFPCGRRLDVPGAIVEKLAYNAQRPDHKPENRAAAGGKAV